MSPLNVMPAPLNVNAQNINSVYIKSLNDPHDCSPHPASNDNRSLTCCLFTTCTRAFLLWKLHP